MSEIRGHCIMHLQYRVCYNPTLLVTQVLCCLPDDRAAVTPGHRRSEAALGFSLLIHVQIDL